MRAARKGFLPRVERRLVDMVMAALVLVLERLVVHSIRRDAKRVAPRRPSR